MSGPTGGAGGPRRAYQLVIDAFGLYRRYPLLFLVLAAAVVLPYEVIVLVATGAGPFEQGSVDFTVSLWLSLTDLALVAPLVSALHIHAVREVREGDEPRLGSIARQGLKVLPVVAAVSIVSWLGILLGFLALIAPGIYLMLRWFVVAQAAAIEGEGWVDALRSSGRLTEGHYGHVFVFAVFVGVVAAVPVFLVGLAFGGDSTNVASFLVGVSVQVLAYSFGALATALLYFDLRARMEGAPASVPAGQGGPTPQGGPPGPQSQDPRDYAEEERPKGWYVDPGNPTRMRYWEAGDPPRWSTATTRTPRKIREAWDARERESSGANMG
ncbi:MAG TPA: hypothetical protein VEW07_10630 [Solirubrobacterales bacterium]|nr:hypothetical protein [Solirubrobacterales bacterium]